MTQNSHSDNNVTEQVLVSYDKKFFLQDFEACSLSIKKKDFTNANIFANRIMSNAFLFDKQNFGLMGSFLKQIANDGILMRRLNTIEGEDSISNSAKPFINTIKTQVESQQYDLENLWTEFNNFFIKTRSFHLLEDEKTAYKEINSKFTESAFVSIIKEFEKNKNTLLHFSNNLLKGTINEMTRICKTHGTTPQHQCLLSVITMLDRIDEYIHTTSTSEEDFDKRVKEDVIPLTEEFFKIKSTASDYVNDFNDFLWALIKIWRLLYIKYMELAKASIRLNPEQSNVKEPIKAKLVDEIAKGLEEEVGIK